MKEKKLTEIFHDELSLFLIFFGFAASFSRTVVFDLRLDLLFVVVLIVHIITSLSLGKRTRLIANALILGIIILLLSNKFIIIDSFKASLLKNLSLIFDINQIQDGIEYFFKLISTGISGPDDPILIANFLFFIMISFLIRLLIKTKPDVLIITLIFYEIFLWINYYDIAIVSISLILIGYVPNLIERLEKNLEIREAYSSDHFNMVALKRFSSIFAITVVISANIIVNFFPLEKINLFLSEYIPHISSLRSGYEKGTSQYAFNFRNTIYQPNEKLGGPIGIPEDIVLMKVESKLPRLYLRGEIKDIYQGDKWLNNKYEYAQPTFDNNYKKANSATIKYENIETGTVFTTIDTYSIDLSKSKLIRNIQNLFFYSPSVFEDQKWDYEIYFSNEYKMDNDLPIDNYIQLPQTITKRTIDLSNQITKGLTNDNDKIIALVEYLQSNYRYSLYVPEVPENTDFVDYFLFDSNEGYCTYFATSLAVLARIEGIPTRYVEGFTTPSWPNYQGIYEIKPRNAHAWVEVYIKDKGWTVVDPTPSSFSGLVDDEFYERIEDKNPITPSDINSQEPQNQIEPQNQSNYSKSSISISWIIIFLVIISPLLLVLRKYKRKKSLEKKIKLLMKKMNQRNVKEIPVVIPEDFIFYYCVTTLNYTLSISDYSLLQKYFYYKIIDDNEFQRLNDIVDLLLNIIRNRGIKKNANRK